MSKYNVFYKNILTNYILSVIILFVIESKIINKHIIVDKLSFIDMKDLLLNNIPY